MAWSSGNTPSFATLEIPVRIGHPLLKAVLTMEHPRWTRFFHENMHVMYLVISQLWFSPMDFGRHWTFESMEPSFPMPQRHFARVKFELLAPWIRYVAVKQMNNRFNPFQSNVRCCLLHTIIPHCCSRANIIFLLASSWAFIILCR